MRAPVVPYESQIRVMSQVVRAASRGACALIESPTGSGKSLALLCAALAWREREMEKREEGKAKATVDGEDDGGEEDGENSGTALGGGCSISGAAAILCSSLLDS